VLPRRRCLCSVARHAIRAARVLAPSVLPVSWLPSASHRRRIQYPCRWCRAAITCAGIAEPGGHRPWEAQDSSTVAVGSQAAVAAGAIGLTGVRASAPNPWRRRYPRPERDAAAATLLRPYRPISFASVVCPVMALSLAVTVHLSRSMELSMSGPRQSSVNRISRLGYRYLTMRRASRQG